MFYDIQAKILKSSITGKYETAGDINKADRIIGQSFGASENGPGHVNELLAKYIIQKTSNDLPLLVQSEITEALDDSNRVPDLIISGEVSIHLEKNSIRGRS